MVEEKEKPKGNHREIKFFALGLILGLVLGVSSLVGFASINQNGLTAREAGEKAINFISENLLAPGINAQLLSVEEVKGSDVYKISINISRGDAYQIVESYVTKDGSYLFPTGLPMTGAFAEKLKSQKKENSETEMEIPKAEKPQVKLFIMSHCPFGLQALKAFLPVYKLLNGKADMKIHFVDYIMHGKKEIDENMRIYCIQKEQEDKLYDYLSCFVKDGDWESCIEEAGIDKDKLEACIEATDKKYNITALYNNRSTWSFGRFPKFPVDENLNKLYGVRGSPTVVINNKTVAVVRSPEGFLEAICSGFIEKPAECNQKLSSSIASPGFGTGSSSSSSGRC